MRKLLFFISLTLAAAMPVQAQQPPPRPAAGSAHFGWADVLRVDPVYDSVRVERPSQVCHDETVERHEGGNTTAGTLLGAVVGGVLGHTVGKGDGRRAATVAGAVAGGAIGNHVARNNDRVYEDQVTQCDPVNSVSHERRLVGYDVEYSYHGEIYVSRLGYDPGERLRVRVSVSPAD